MVAVTGAGGFIGSAIVRALFESGVSVRALTGDYGHKVIDPPIGVQTERGDVCDLPAMCRFLKGIETVVHAAGPPSVAESFNSVMNYVHVHTFGTATVLEACRKSSVQRFVYISSAEVYGQPKTGVATENGFLEPHSPYGAAKAAAEFFVKAFRKSFGVECIILRPFSVYGPNLGTQSLISTIMRQALKSRKVVVSDTRPVRDYCYIDDVVRAVLCSCKRRFDEIFVFNVGTGIGTSVSQLARLILTIVSRDIPIVEALSSDRPRTSEVFRLVADTRNAREQLGWQASYKLKSGLELTIKSLQLI